MIVVDDVKVGKNQGGKADKFMTENFTLMESGKLGASKPQPTLVYSTGEPLGRPSHIALISKRLQ